MTRRLEDLRLLLPGTRELLKQVRLRVREARELLGLPPHPTNNELLPIRYQYLALEAYSRGDLSEDELARCLRTSRVQARLLAERLTRISPDEGAFDLTAPVPGETCSCVA